MEVNVTLFFNFVNTIIIVRKILSRLFALVKKKQLKKNSTLWLDDRKRLNTLLLYNVTLTFYGVLSVWEYNHHWFAWRMAVAQMALLLEFSVPSIGFELRLCGSGSFFRFPWFNYLS